MSEHDLTTLDEMIHRVGVSPLLFALAERARIQSIKTRRLRQDAMNQEAKSRYRLMGRKLETASAKIAKIAVELKHVDPREIEKQKA